MKKLLSLLSIGCVALFGVFACLGGDDKGSGGGLSGSIKIIGLDEVNHWIATEIITHRCEGTTVLTDTTRDTSSYAITGGHLYIWGGDADCGADRLSGSSSTIIGTWTLVPGAVAIPVSSRPANCTDVVPLDDEGLNGMLEAIPGAQIVLSVSANSVALSVMRCPNHRGNVHRPVADHHGDQHHLHGRHVAQ
jgi:hypothetical protein